MTIKRASALGLKETGKVSSELPLEPFVLEIKDGSIWYETDEGMTGVMTLEVARQEYDVVDQLDDEDADCSIERLAEEGVTSPL